VGIEKVDTALGGGGDSIPSNPSVSSVSLNDNGQYAAAYTIGPFLGIDF
jgi:hypothetical protein